MSASEIILLEINGIRTRAETELLEDAMIGTARHELTNADLVQHLRELFPL